MRVTPIVTAHPATTTTTMPQREPTTQSQPTTHQQPSMRHAGTSTWCLSTITSTIQLTPAGHLSSPMATMSCIPLFAQQLAFNPYSYYYQGMCPQHSHKKKQKSRHTGAGYTLTHHGTNGVELTVKSVGAYPTQAVYVPQTSGYKHECDYEYGQGYARPSHMQHTVASGVLGYPHMYDSTHRSGWKRGSPAPTSRSHCPETPLRKVKGDANSIMACKQKEGDYIRAYYDWFTLATLSVPGHEEILVTGAFA
ncbi:unnamed protein product [Lactuca saligna]|uniref:Uncharacterized protein n=1 Tax=Lactuca saligna TaxID=75948 RepID=A0AA35VDJ6_LACSI|nr:unnamed protein product [Lactuca saligna]